MHNSTTTNTNNLNNNNNLNLNNNTNVGTARVNTTQACAACKYQRRKCAPDCILAPYFPHDRQRQFLNAHKLFGVSNITKIIRNLDQPAKDQAMRTIIFQSDVRAADPVGGCLTIIENLQRQIEYTRAELNLVLHHLDLCRAQAAQQQMLMPDDDEVAANSTGNCDIFGIEALGGSYEQLQIGGYNHNHNHQQQFQQPQHHHLEQQQYVIHVDHNNGNGNENENAAVALQEATTDSWGMQASTASSVIPITRQHHSIQECNSVFKPLFDALSDDPQDFRFESEQANDHSDEQASLKNHDQLGFGEDEDSFHCAGEHHDLKGAATLFSLTKCNT